MKRGLLGFGLFLEFAVLGALLWVLLGGGLSEEPAGLVWGAGVVLMLSAAMAWGLPDAWARRGLLHGALISGSLLFMLPFLWLLSTSFKYPEETFTYPPTWVPQVPDPQRASPYVLAYTGDPLPPLVAQALWAEAQPLLPPAELASVDESAARDALTGRLWESLMRSGGASADGEVLRPLPAELISETWGQIYRAAGVGRIAARDTRRQTIPLPPQAVRWQSVGPVRLIEAGETLLMQYGAGLREPIELTATIDAAALPAELEAISLAMRQDRSWQRVVVGARWRGRTYQTEDALYLGARGWVEWGFKFADVDARDERSTGVWLLRPVGETTHVVADAANVGGVGSSGGADGGELALTVRIEPVSRWTAAWAKYTASYRSAWHSDPHWGRYFLNSALLVVLSVIGQLLSCSMVAYAFARLRWPGRDTLFVILLATMMLPGMVTMIPVFLIFKKLGWYNTLLPLWVPSFFGSAFFVFMLRQFMKAIPRELEEAALIDGCSWFGIYWRIILPLMKPALTAVAIFTFMGVWNEFMGPLIYLSDQRRYPLSLGLFNFRSQYGSDFAMLMAASSMLTIPVILLFFVAQRYFIQGVTLTGLKS